jgi:16S rRNA processing protein RimM
VYLGGVRRTVEQARPDQDQWILKLSGLAGRTAAESFRGELVEAADNDVLRDDDESYFVHELIGLRVVTEDGRDLGTVVEVNRCIGRGDSYYTFAGNAGRNEIND